METFERDVNKKKTKGERGVNVLEHYAKPLAGADSCIRLEETLRVFAHLQWNSQCLQRADTWVRLYGEIPMWWMNGLFGVAVNTFFLPDRGR